MLRSKLACGVAQEDALRGDEDRSAANLASPSQAGGGRVRSIDALGFAALVCACAGASGCATATLTAAAGIGLYAAQERTIGQGLDDAAASAELKTRLLAMDAAAFSRVDVEVAEGRALLTGAAPTAEHRIAAERAAWGIAAVSAVANEIEVGPSAGVWRNVRDEVITAQVRARMASAADVRAIDINIETYRGVVYLMGLTRTPAEAERAAEIASRVGGVEKVVTYIDARRTAPDFPDPSRPRAPIEAGRATETVAAAGDFTAASATGGGADWARSESAGAPLFPRK